MSALDLKTARLDHPLASALAALPAFAARHARDLVMMLPDWPPVHDPSQSYLTGGCTLFALALRAWSRGRLALLSVYGHNGSHVHSVGVLPLPGGGLVGVDATGVHDLRAGWYMDPTSFEGVSAPLRYGRCGYRRAVHEEGRASDAALHFVAHLADAMDREIGDGAQLFAGLPPQPVDATKLF